MTSLIFRDDRLRSFGWDHEFWNFYLKILVLVLGRLFEYPYLPRVFINEVMTTTTTTMIPTIAVAVAVATE
ncbi:uncharacterized protein K489DRAFT_259735 [Dissoconium aciculare CBS 342.82]|uniref:Uncharacterized protein n=1 Tax=Dissoconium aciculare CBS 342.82 TaxID=1314786 RepID=A0A6J3LYP1_9PEZI|nr:uncharacterized protein K489DRAFT_259735 [Dissoconium aciculare CBS 342.82]KAF1820890.1 hypothetical protein K489DRAFT_259735 [Dissoconium aciculare CBS 342.82]